jgi:hypothetical protein
MGKVALCLVDVVSIETIGNHSHVAGNSKYREATSVPNVQAWLQRQTRRMQIDSTDPEHRA